MQGDIPLLDTEIPAANGVATARALAKMYGAIANGGRVDGTQFLSPERVAGLTGRAELRPGPQLFVPLSFHLGYHWCRPRACMPGFGHAGLAARWAGPIRAGMAFGFVHNRLLTPDGAGSGDVRAAASADSPRGGARPQARVRDDARARRAVRQCHATSSTLSVENLNQPVVGAWRVNHFVLLRHDSADVMAKPAPHMQANTHTRMRAGVRRLQRRDEGGGEADEARGDAGGRRDEIDVGDASGPRVLPQDQQRSRTVSQ